MRLLELNLHQTLPLHADPFKSRPLVCVCFDLVWSTLHNTCTLELCFGHHTGWTVCFQQKKEVIIRKSMLEIYPKLLHCAPLTYLRYDDVMHHKLTLSLSLSLLYFTTHATTSHLRNGVGNCVCHSSDTPCVCNECVYVECVLHVCLRDNMC